MQELKIKGINKIAEIIICGAIRISVNETDYSDACVDYEGRE